MSTEYSTSNWAHKALALMDEVDSLIRWGCVSADAERYTPAAKAFWEVCTMLAEERARLQPAEPVSVGDYVLATKYSDGDPGDHWGVGYYDGERRGRYFVKDSRGQQIRAGGFRKVARIPVDVGHWLLTNAAALEASPPGSVNLWKMLSIVAHQPSDKIDQEQKVD